MSAPSPRDMYADTPAWGAGAKVQQKNDMGKKSDIFYEKYGIKSDFNGRSGRGGTVDIPECHSG